MSDKTEVKALDHNGKSFRSRLSNLMEEFGVDIEIDNGVRTNPKGGIDLGTQKIIFEGLKVNGEDKWKFEVPFEEFYIDGTYIRRGEK